MQSASDIDAIWTFIAVVVLFLGVKSEELALQDGLFLSRGMI